MLIGQLAAVDWPAVHWRPLTGQLVDSLTSFVTLTGQLLAFE